MPPHLLLYHLGASGPAEKVWPTLGDLPHAGVGSAMGCNADLGDYDSFLYWAKECHEAHAAT